MYDHQGNESLSIDNGTLSDQLPDSIKLTYYILGVPLSILLIFTSLVLFAAIAKSCSLAKKLNFIACNLAFCDLLLGITLVINIGLLEEHPDLTDSTPCRIIGILELLPVVTGFLFLALIHIDRFLAVCVPTVYPDLWTTRRVAATCAGIWVFAVVFSALAFAFGEGDRDGGVVVCDVLALPRGFLLLSVLLHIPPCCAICLILGLRINHMLKVHQRKIQVTNTLTYTNLVDDAHLAQLFYILAIVSFISWLPFVISIIVWFCDDTLPSLGPAVRVCFLLGHLSGLKLVIYVLHSSTYKAAVKKLFNPLKKQHSHNVRGSPGIQ